MKALAIIPLFAMIVPKAAEACAVCFGLSDQPTRDATQKAILFLMGLTALVLIGLTFAVVHIIRHHKHVEKPKPS